MKKMIFILFVMFGIKTYAQLPINNLYFDQVKSSLLLDSFRYKKSTTNNEIYLFESWYNSGRIVQDNKIYKLGSLNYNIRNDRFEAKFDQDSIFVINSPEDVVVEVNNRKFKRFLDPDTKRSTFFEVVANFKGGSIIIRHGLKVEEGSINPLTKETSGPDVLVKKEDYFYTKDTNSYLIKIKLNKKSIIDLIVESKKTEIQKFAKGNKLKYTKVNDVAKILKYYDSI